MSNDPADLPVSLPTSTGRFVTLRLRPGEEVLESLQALVTRQGWAAVSIVSVVGSLTDAVIRYANQPGPSYRHGHFEVVAMSGTLEAAPPEGLEPAQPEGLEADSRPTLGGAHVHIGLSDGAGVMFGGHMLPGCRVYTTLEIVLLILEELRFTRSHCDLSGYPELVITSRGTGE